MSRVISRKFLGHALAASGKIDHAESVLRAASSGIGGRGFGALAPRA